MPSRVVVLSVLALVLLSGPMLAGCLDDPKGVYVPRGELSADWVQVGDNQTQEAANGLVEIIINRYKFESDLVAEMYLVAMTDVPFVDEHEEIQDRIGGYAAASQVELRETGTRTVELDNGKTAKVTEYEIEKVVDDNTLRGKALLVKWETKDFVASALGFATTEYQGLFGTAEDDTQWKNVQDMLQAADW